MEGLTKEKHEKLLKELDSFKNTTEYAKKYKIINEKDKPMLDYCHKARNNVYHHFYEDERITNSCVFILSEFLFHNVLNLLETGIKVSSDNIRRNQNKIFEIGNIKSFEDVLDNLNALCTNNIKPSEIFSQILIDELTELIEFYESSANENWEEFNSIIRKQYFWDVSYKNEKEKNNQIDLDLFASDFKKKWKNLKQKDFDNYKQKAIALKKLPTNDSFVKFINIKDKLTPFYLGMRYYIS
jgi:lipoate-protein ligase A